MYKKRIRAWGLAKNTKASEKNAAITELLNDTPVAERTHAINPDKLVRHARRLVRAGLMEKRSLQRIVQRGRTSRLSSCPSSPDPDTPESLVEQMPSPRNTLALPDDLANIDQLIRALQRTTIYHNSELPFGDNRLSRRLVGALENGRRHWRLHAFATAREHFEKAGEVIMNWLSNGIVPSMTIIQNLSPGAWAGCTDLLASFSQFTLKVIQLYLSSSHPLSLVTVSLQKVPPSVDRDFLVWNCIFDHYKLSADNQEEWQIVASSRLKCCRENGMSTQLARYADAAMLILKGQNLPINRAEIDHAFWRGIDNKAQHNIEGAINAFETVISLAARRTSAWDPMYEIEAIRELAHIHAYYDGDIYQAKRYFNWALDLCLQQYDYRDDISADCLRDLLLFFQHVGLTWGLGSIQRRYPQTYNHLEAITEGLWARESDIRSVQPFGGWHHHAASHAFTDNDTKMVYDEQQ